MSELKPITIAGGGLAGLSLGIALRSREIPVTVVESGSYPRHRVCGEFISGVTAADLEKLTLPDLLAEAIPNISTSWFSGDDCFLENELPKPAMGISRFKMDVELAERFSESGGTLQTGTRFSPTSDGAEPGTVFAIGRPRRTDSDWIGLKMHVRDFPLHTDLEMHLGNGGYLGISRIEEGAANACGLFRVQKSIKAPKTKLLLAYLEANGLKQLASRIQKSEIVSESCLGVNAFQLGHQLSDSKSPRKLTIGDQFAIIGPFTGNGMSMAFQSSALALDPISAYAKGELSWSDCIQETTGNLRAHFKTRLRFSRALHPFLAGGMPKRWLVELGRRNLLPFSLLFKLLRA